MGKKILCPPCAKERSDEEFMPPLPFMSRYFSIRFTVAGRQWRHRESVNYFSNFTKNKKMKIKFEKIISPISGILTARQFYWSTRYPWFLHHLLLDQ